MTETSPRLALPYLQPSQAQKHVTHNEALERLDALTQLVVVRFDATVPPADPEPGEVHALGPAPTQDWEGRGGMLAVRTQGGWLFIPPQDGWRAWGLLEDELRIHAGGGWQQVRPTLQGLEGVGINATSDPVNRLALSSEATLFSHDGAGHQVKINKAAAGDTATLLYQSEWTGHAEMGLAGDNAFSLKVSADGDAWFTALRADPQAATVSFAPGGTDRMRLSDAALWLDVPVGGAAVQVDQADAGPGRLLKVGAFGLGGDAAPPLADLDATDTPAGFWTTADTPPSAGTFPPGIAEGPARRGHLTVHRPAGGMVQVWRGLGQDGHWVRQWNGGFTGWQRHGAATGTVSQSGGVPTGAVVERGGNAHGHWVRWADGTQICWATQTQAGVAIATPTGGALMSDALEIVFPVPFSATPVANVSATPAGGALDGWPIVQGISATGLTMRHLRLTSASAQDMTLRYQATGRWF